jgi:hypothetical protein
MVNVEVQYFEMIKNHSKRGKSIFHTLSAEYFQQMIYKTIMLFRKMRACIYMIYFKKLRMHVCIFRNNFDSSSACSIY